MKKVNWIWVAGVAVAGSTVALVASGATYNFYFNNTEQGDNGTATPSVSVTTDAKGAPTSVSQSKADGDKPLPALEGPPKKLDALAAPAATPGPASNMSAAELSFISAGFDDPAPKWRLTLGAMMVPQYQFVQQYDPDVGYYDSTNGYTDMTNHECGTLGLSYFPLTWLGFSAYTGVYHDYDGVTEVLALAEVELVPVRLSVAAVPDVIELGLLAGASNISERKDDAWNWAHVGARASVNLNRHLGVTAAARFAPYFLGGEAGLTLRL